MVKVRCGCLGILRLVNISFFAAIIESAAWPPSLLITCGTNSVVVVEGRKWVGDSAAALRNNVVLTSPGITASTAHFNGDSVYAPLYRTARFFDMDANYTIQGAPGYRYFLRLHFHPFSFAGHRANESSFDVAANGLKLLYKFNPLEEIWRRNSSGWGGNGSILVKEYFLVINSGALEISFIPADRSFGFVTAIELVPVRDGLFAKTASRVGGGGGGDPDLTSRGMETMYRLNVGGPEIEPGQDGALWRRWRVDSGFMFREDAGFEISNTSGVSYAALDETSAAPLLVYETARMMSDAQVVDRRFNMSWRFGVDPGFDYLIRLHFCELVFAAANRRSFRIYVNNRTAADGFDVFARAGGMNSAYHQDYLDSPSSKTDTLWIQLGPDAAAAAASDALLNGLEIFKLSRDGDLASAPNLDSVTDLDGNDGLRNRVVRVGIGAGIVSAAMLSVVAAVIFRNCCWRWRNRPLFAVAQTAAVAKDDRNRKLGGSVRSTRAGRRFTVSEIRAATNNFDVSLVIGVGGFGTVYRGEIDGGAPVAVKRAHPRSRQGSAEFETEIETLSKLRHRHLVRLIGSCGERGEMILVYEYMRKGTLRSHLFGSGAPLLSWEGRLGACIGAARGLHYLHTGAVGGIIHRDVKTTNILLDDDFVAKVADFGLSKAGPAALDRSHVSTAVKGSFGYLDPEYFRRQQLTEKSDVYSFGVVLLEVVCGRAVIDPSLPKEEINLAEWALLRGSLETSFDRRLRGGSCPESLRRVGEIAGKCLADEGRSRPTMGEVLWHLECALRVQEAWLLGNPEKAKLFT